MLQAFGLFFCYFYVCLSWMSLLSGRPIHRSTAVL
uniref:Uncharacterized protein n=1 Tax=Anguilla anguilla TaxID=7936 RepID=A0A0E9V0H6_ANGAN